MPAALPKLENFRCSPCVGITASRFASTILLPQSCFDDAKLKPGFDGKIDSLHRCTTELLLLSGFSFVFGACLTRMWLILCTRLIGEQ